MGCLLYLLYNKCALFILGRYVELGKKVNMNKVWISLTGFRIQMILYINFSLIIYTWARPSYYFVIFILDTVLGVVFRRGKKLEVKQLSQSLILNSAICDFKIITTTYLVSSPTPWHNIFIFSSRFILCYTIFSFYYLCSIVVFVLLSIIVFLQLLFATFI